MDSSIDIIERPCETRARSLIVERHPELTNGLVLKPFTKHWKTLFLYFRNHSYALLRTLWTYAPKYVSSACWCTPCTTVRLYLACEDLPPRASVSEHVARRLNHSGAAHN